MVAPDGLRIDTDKPARTTLRDIVIAHRIECCSPSHIRCRQLFPSKSFNTTLSSIVTSHAIRNNHEVVIVLESVLVLRSIVPNVAETFYFNTQNLANLLGAFVGNDMSTNANV